MSGMGASVEVAGPSSLVDCGARVVSGVTSPCEISNSRKASSAIVFLGGRLALDFLDAFAGEISRDANLGPVLVDLILKDLFGPGRSRS